jgi:predicted ATPase
LAERTAREAHIRLRYFCSPHHQDSALYPVIAQMERAAGFARDDTSEAKLSKLRMLFASTATPSEDLALIAELHSLRSADLAPLPDVTPQRRRQKTFEALLRQVERLSTEQPVLVEFEDVHWIDFSSREFLDRVVERIGNCAVLLIATFRPEFQPPWTGQPQVTMLALGRLGRIETAKLVEQIAGHDELSPETVQEIVERTDGVPLFIEELTKAVLEAAPQGETQPSPLQLAVSIPATLHASLMARLDRLGPAAKGIAQIGAVLGRVFSYDVLLAVARPQPEQQLREALERLVSAELVSQIGVPPDALYSFKHALVQDTAYANLLRGRRQKLHGHIAGIIEKAFPDTAEAQPDLIAHHYTQGGLGRRAVHWWRAAGAQAIRLSANVEAVSHLKRALELINSGPAGQERDLLELDVRVELGGPLIGTAGYGAPELEENYARAWALCESAGTTQQIFPVLWGLYVTAVNRAETGMSEAHEMAARFLLLAQQQENVGLETVGHRLVGVMLVSLGQFAAGRDHLERAVALYGPERHGLEAAFGIHPRISALANLSLALQYLGHLDLASQTADQAVEEATRLGQFNTRGVALHLNARLRAFRRQSQLVQKAASELIALSRQHGSPDWELVGDFLMGWQEAQQGSLEDGLQQMRQGIEGLRAKRVNAWLPCYLVLLAEVESRERGHDEALRLLDEAEELIVAQEHPVLEAEIHRLRATALLSQGAPDTLIEAGYERALSVARGQSARFWELRAAVSLARFRRSQGKIAEALATLVPVYDGFSEGFDTPDLAEAKALLDDMRAVANAP